MTTILLIGANNRSPAFAVNDHRIILDHETPVAFVGWPDPTDQRNSAHWKPGVDKPLFYPKSAWRVLP